MSPPLLSPENLVSPESLLSPENLAELLSNSPLHRACLEALRDEALPDCWIGAGFLRNLVWDRLHGYDSLTPLADVDVVYFDPSDPQGQQETEIERRLTRRLRPTGHTVIWEARNQARMHQRNGDRPYRDTAHSLTHWLETPTAVAVRLRPQVDRGDETDRDRDLDWASMEFLAPFGFDDLFSLVLRPTPHACSHPERLAAYQQRLASKPWRENWPLLTVELS